MIEPVSNAAIGQNIRAMDRVPQEKLYSPGLYSIHQMTAPPSYKQKDGGFLSFLGKLALFGIIICGSAVAAKKTVLKGIDISNELPKDTKPMEKTKYYIAKFGDWIETKLKNIFNKSEKTEKAEDPKPPNHDGHHDCSGHDHK